MDKINKGKKMVIIMIMIVLLIDIFTIASTISNYIWEDQMNLVPYKLFQGIVRLILTALLMFFLYKGKRWAKWITIILFFTAGISSLLIMLTTFNILLFSIGVVYTIFGVMMIVPGNVYYFLQDQSY